MFKYVWIIMLVIAAVIFIGYTIYAIYDSYCMAVLRTATRSECDYGVKRVLSKTLSNFWFFHYTICGAWIVIFLTIIVATFLFSIFAYGSSNVGG